MKNDTSNPMDWTNGPPKSESESWAWARRCETGTLAGQLLRSRYDAADAAMFDPEEEAERAVKAALAFHKVLDRLLPRK